jgi:hypothetical protein
VIFVAEIYAAVDPEGTEQRFLFSTIPFHTGEGGSPQTRHHIRLMQPANFAQHRVGQALQQTRHHMAG